MENPYYTPRQICEKLGLDHSEYSGYVRKEKSLSKRYTVTVTPHETHRNRFVWNVPEWNNYRNALICKTEFGWNICRHNRLLFYRDEKGSVLWHNTDKIELFLKGPFHLGFVKQLFCKAFNPVVSDWKEVDFVLSKKELVGRHHTFGLGQPLPRFHIGYFTRSLGLTIYNDASHSNAIEVDEQKPFWLDEMREIGEGFKEDMNRHMTLLNQMCELQIRIAKSRPSLAKLFELLKKVLGLVRGKAASSTRKTFPWHVVQTGKDYGGALSSPGAPGSPQTCAELSREKRQRQER
jgi:hypothetical protein